jgi:hypothetical protein
MDDLTIRHQLAAARAALRTTQDDHDRIKAGTEHAVITHAGGSKQLGTNAEERERALRLALEDNPAYLGIRHTLRHWQAEVDRLQAQLDDDIDARRSLDRASRDRLSTALEAVSAHVAERGSVITILATPQAA